MVIKNPWVGYLDRSYAAIKSSVLTRLQLKAPEITDYSESNILIVIVSMFAGIAEMLNYYIDNMAREAFLSTARKWDSIVKLTTLTNYRIRASISASVDLKFTLVDADELPVALLEGNTVTIPLGTKVTNSQGIQFLTTRATYITGGLYHVTVPARQQLVVSEYQLALGTGTANQAYQLPLNYDDSTLYVKVAGLTWDIKEHLGHSWGNSKHFAVEVRANGYPYLIFGDGVHGKIPGNGEAIRVAYRTTAGAKGILPEDTLTTIVTSITLPTQDPAIDKIMVTNPDWSSGGLPIEDLERVRRSAPLALRTLDKAVSRQDFIDIAKLAPAVDKATVVFNCGKKVVHYVSPVGGGIASSQMLADTKTFIENRKIIGLGVDVKAAGETFIGMVIDVTAKFRVNTDLVEKDIKLALVDGYSSENSDINLPIRTSDITALIDNLERVDFLNLVSIQAIPYARGINNSIQLDWDRTLGAASLTRQVWYIVYSSGNWQLVKGTSLIQTLTVGVPYNHNDIFTIKINSTPPGTASGDRWQFITYPINQDILLDDNTMPRIHPNLNYVTININEQSY